MLGVTWIDTLWPALTVADVGVKWKKSGVVEPVPVNVMGDEVRFETVKVCGASVAPGAPINTSPPGDTTGGATVPAGTMLNTIAIDTGGWIPSVGVSVTVPK